MSRIKEFLEDVYSIGLEPLDTISATFDAMQMALDALHRCDCCQRFLPRRVLKPYVYREFPQYEISGLMCADKRECVDALLKECA